MKRINVEETKQDILRLNGLVPFEEKMTFY